MQTWRDGRRNKREGCERQCVIGSLERVMIGRNVIMEVKRGLRNSILVPTLMYKSKT